jgi:hypothetical protein
LATGRAMCRATRTRGVGEGVDDEPRDVLMHTDAQRGEVVDDERRDEPRDVPRHQDTRRSRS